MALADSELMTRVGARSFEVAWKIPASGKCNKDLNDGGWNLMFVKSLAPWALCPNGEPPETPRPSRLWLGGFSVSR